MPKTSKRKLSSPLKLNLALKGGGTQGAFTWGVLDRLLEVEEIEIARISGTSAGALNGAAYATGYARGGREGAKQHLDLLWDQVAQAGSLLTFLLLPLRKPGMGLWDDAVPILSPYQTNPLGMAPLRYVLNTVFDPDLLRDSRAGVPQLFVNVLHVQSGRERVFGPQDMSVEAVLASACAPLSYQAVEVDGEDYWDGSYAGNPSLWPLYKDNLDSDILLVELTPVLRGETPRSAKNILNRINEVASVTGLISELRAVEMINRNVPRADIRMHVLSITDEGAGALATEPSVKRTVGRVLFEMLRQDGRRACDEWLGRSSHLLGNKSSVDVNTAYLQSFSSPRDQLVSSTAE